MERNMIISLLAGYIVALLPIWNWDSRAELFIATIAISIICMIAITGLQESIKKAFAPGNAKALNK